MSIVELGAMGEFIGSIAVLCTLLYLTVQVRQSTRQSRAQLLQHRNDAARALWLAGATNESLRKAVCKANANLGQTRWAGLAERAGLSDEEAFAVGEWAGAQFFHRQTLFLSDLSDKERSTLDRQLTAMFSNGVLSVWLDDVPGKGGFDPDFLDRVKMLTGRTGDVRSADAPTSDSE